MPNLAQLAAKSKARIQDSEVFRLIDEDAKRLKDNQDDTAYPIDLAGFSQVIDDRKEESKKIYRYFRQRHCRAENPKYGNRLRGNGVRFC